METMLAVLYILKLAHPDEVDFLGSAVVENTINNVNMGEAKYASNLDSTEMLATVLTAINIIKPLVETFSLLYDRFKRNPTKEELKKELAKSEVKDNADKYVDLLINYYLDKNSSHD